MDYHLEYFLQADLWWKKDAIVNLGSVIYTYLILIFLFKHKHVCEKL